MGPRVRYDDAVLDAQGRRLTLVEHRCDGAAEDVRRLWEFLAPRVQGA